MRIKQLMSADVRSCREETNLADVAKLMWDADCGIIPVVDSEQHLVGVITDRDICMATATRDSTPAALSAGAVMSRDVFCCSDNDDARKVVAVLKDRRVRRLPVVDQQRQLTGIISMNDLVAEASCARDAVIPGEEFIEAMRAICRHPARSYA
jgi:CBS domain-containing protein